MIKEKMEDSTLRNLTFNYQIKEDGFTAGYPEDGMGGFERKDFTESGFQQGGSSQQCEILLRIQIQWELAMSIEFVLMEISEALIRSVLWKSCGWKSEKSGMRNEWEVRNW